MSIVASRQNRLNRDVLEEDSCYWQERLAGTPPVLELPTDRPRSQLQQARTASHLLTLSPTASDILSTISQQEGTPLFTVILAAFQVLLFRYTGQEDIVLGFTLRPSDTPDFDNHLTHTVIRTDLGGDPDFRILLRRLRDDWQNDCKHQRAPLDRSLSEIQSERDVITDPLARVLFCAAPTIGAPRSEWRPAGSLLDSVAAQVDLQVRLCEAPEGLRLWFSYNADLFDPDTIGRMADHLRNLLQGVIDDPGRPISFMPLLARAEHDQILSEWSTTRTDYPRHRCAHQLFEEQVERTPAAPALLFEGQQLSYCDLNNRANQLSRHLRNLGVRPETLVGVCLERTPNMIVALLGILKAGGAYVPLDPQYPSDRLDFMIADSGLKVLLTQEALRPRFSNYEGQLTCVDSDPIFQGESANQPVDIKANNLAYVIYTSGSTGKPKGVQICHYSLVNFLISMRSSPGLTAKDTLLAVTTISFDIAGLEIYLPLIVGARIVLTSRDVAADGNKLHETFKNTTPTVMQATPATWRLLLEAGWSGSTQLTVLCGGEALPRDLALALLKRASSVWNMYGPTETTIWSTVSRITSDAGSVPIGRPIANTDVYVLDKRLQLVPVGVPGELYIGGDGVARGYLNRPELTAEKFIRNPFNKQSGARLYRTGDLARYRADGELECLGRIDNQVKVRGFRIELGEIESLLSEYPGVCQSVVIAREDIPGDKRLVAYMTVNQSQSASPQALRSFLKQKLPAYMLPSQFVFLDDLPLTPNGKLDRTALPRPDEVELKPSGESYTSRDEIESQLVKIWQSVLGFRGVSVKDSFFDLGGHSLLVTQLLIRIEQTFNKSLSMAAVFEAPTIEQQASILRDGGTRSWPSAVVPIKADGAGPTFFWFGFAAGPMFLPLARRLGGRHRLVCVDPTLLNASDLAAPVTMELVATTLLKQVCQIQPQGPYFLGGFCGGALMAYEVASQLVAQGQQISRLALVEPQTPADYEEHPGGSEARALLQRLLFHICNLRHLQAREGRIFIGYRIRVLWEQLLALVFPARRVRRVHSSRSSDVREILDRAYRGYRPQPFPGQITLFQAKERPSERRGDRQYWRDLCAAMEVHEVPGNWNWIIRSFLEPNVEVMANILKDRLAE
jgi:amino acid adenylation domain-containing protein